MITCPKCGTENAEGDAFCGGCGAFLEFAAEEVAEQAGDSTPADSTLADATPADSTAADTVPGAPGGAAPEATAVPGSAATVASGPAATAVPGSASTPMREPTAPEVPAGPTCSVCGRANPAGRTFCISCGERLPAAPRAASPAATAATAAMAATGVRAGSPPSTAAAATPTGGPAGAGGPTHPGGTAAASHPAPAPGPAKPAWDFPTAPVPAAQPSAPVRPPAEATGGRSRLPLIIGGIAVVAILGGGALFAMSGGLGGTGSTASPTPSSAIASPERTVEPSTEPASAEPTAGPTAGTTAAPSPSAPAQPAVGIKVTSTKASTQVASRPSKHLVDGSPATAWKSRSNRYEGAWVELRFKPAAITRIQIWTGWQDSEPIFYGNHRPRNVTVSFDGGEPIPLQLQDVMGAQRVDIPPELGITSATRIRITIADTYRSRKTTAPGSPSKEVAISEIRVYGVPAAP